MPAHLTEKDLALGTATKSDGSLVTARDLWANDVADKLAKLMVEYHRVPAEEVRRWKAAHRTTKARAKWIGMATHVANNVPEFPFRDSEASRWKALAAQRSRTEKKAGIDGRKRRGPRQGKQVILADKGGHHIEAALSGNSWLCGVCRCRSVSRKKLATSRCGGTDTKSWARLSGVPDDSKSEDRRHVMLTSGAVQWCNTCGCLAKAELLSV